MNGTARRQLSVKSFMNRSEVICRCDRRVDAMKSLRLRSSIRGWSAE